MMDLKKLPKLTGLGVDMNILAMAIILFIEFGTKL